MLTGSHSTEPVPFIHDDFLTNQIRVALVIQELCSQLSKLTLFFVNKIYPSAQQPA